MFYFYVLQSVGDRDLYFGFSSDLRQRVKEHNKGRVPATEKTQTTAIGVLRSISLREGRKEQRTAN